MRPDEIDAWLDDPRRPTLVMGVLNVTPDSFSDGGHHATPHAAADAAKRMADDGADWLDVGGESTRPGSDPVDEVEQIRRVLPAIEAAAKLDLVVSVDTTRAAVARAALDAGASVVNDVSAAQDDPAMFAVMATARAAILMHMKGTPRDMQRDPAYADVVAEVESHLLARCRAAEAAGVPRLLIDPGIGFGKTLQHNLDLLHALPRLAAHDRPILIGASRKRFLGVLTNEPVAERRVMGTAATVAWSVLHGAAVVRVHDVRAMRQVIDVTRAMLNPASVAEAGLAGDDVRR